MSTEWCLCGSLHGKTCRPRCTITAFIPHPSPVLCMGRSQHSLIRDRASLIGVSQALQRGERGKQPDHPACTEETNRTVPVFNHPRPERTNPCASSTSVDL